MTRRPHRRLSVIVAVVAGIAGIAACGSEDTGGAIVAADGDTPATAPPGSDGGTAEARLVEPTPGLTGVIGTAIDSVVVIDDVTLEAQFYNGVEPCYGVDHAIATEAADSVTIEVGVGSNPDAGDVACVELAELQAVRVTLAAPLGNRAVFDATTGQPLPATPAG